MTRPDFQPLDASDTERLVSLFSGAVAQHQDAYPDPDALMEAVVGLLIAEIDRLRETGDAWAARWSHRVVELALTRLAERRIQESHR